jgi:hypothetical protein
MSIVRDLGDKCKSLAPSLFIPALIIVVATLAFGLGRVSRVVSEREPIKIENASAASQAVPGPVVSTPLAPNPLPLAPTQTIGGGEVAASKNGTKYYFPNCSGLKRVKAENLIWFESEAKAQAAGLSLASGCRSN